jgi:hypothetical protein
LNAHHYKAPYWVGQGVFDSVASFREFEARGVDIFEEKVEPGWREATAEEIMDAHRSVFQS